jgi:DNA recombination protein RmuC
MEAVALWQAGVAAAGVLALGLALVLRSVRHELAGLRAELPALREGLAVARAESERLLRVEGEAATERSARHGAEVRAAGLERELAALRDEHAARLDELRRAKEELGTRFESLAAQVLDRNAKSFLDLLTERYRTHETVSAEEIDKRRTAIEALVRPLDEKLAEFKTHVREIEAARQEAYVKINEQVKALADGQASLGLETRKLVQALRAPKTRGRWGEMQLRRVFDLAGMAEHVDFTLEAHHATDGGALRPDAIVRIPGGKRIVIDAKTPLEAYLDALEAEAPEVQAQALARHSAQVREHVKLLASKSYQDAVGGTPDFVVMFIPGETFVAAAVEADRGLFEFAFERKVLIATPTTLMALVKAIAYGWQQEKMAANAAEVQRIGKELHDRLRVFGGHLSDVGKGLERAAKSYNAAVGSFEGRILPSARRFDALGVVPAGAEIEAPGAVETAPRLLPSATGESAGEG